MPFDSNVMYGAAMPNAMSQPMNQMPMQMPAQTSYMPTMDATMMRSAMDTGVMPVMDMDMQAPAIDAGVMPVHEVMPAVEAPAMPATDVSAIEAPKQTLPDSGSVGWLLFGLIMPIVGLVLYVAWFKDKPQCAHKVGLGAIIGSLFGMLAIVAVVVLSMTVFSSLLSFMPL